MLNRIQVIGYTGKDAEYIGDNTLSKVTLATTDKWVDSKGEKHEKTDWHTILFTGKLADIAQQYCKKGKKIYVDGKLTYNEWEKDGVKHTSTNIIAKELIFLD